MQMIKDELEKEHTVAGKINISLSEYTIKGKPSISKRKKRSTGHIIVSGLTNISFFYIKQGEKVINKMYFKGPYKDMIEKTTLKNQVSTFLFIKRLKAFVYTDYYGGIWLKPLKPIGNFIEIPLDKFKSFKSSKMFLITGNTMSYQIDPRSIKIIPNLLLDTVANQKRVISLEGVLDNPKQIQDHRLLTKKHSQILTILLCVDKSFMVLDEKGSLVSKYNLGRNIKGVSTCMDLSRDEQHLVIGSRELVERINIVSIFKIIGSSRIRFKLTKQWVVPFHSPLNDIKFGMKLGKHPLVVANASNFNAFAVVFGFFEQGVKEIQVAWKSSLQVSMNKKCDLLVFPDDPGKFSLLKFDNKPSNKN